MIWDKSIRSLTFRDLEFKLNSNVPFKKFDLKRFIDSTLLNFHKVHQA